MHTVNIKKVILLFIFLSLLSGFLVTINYILALAIPIFLIVLYLIYKNKYFFYLFLLIIPLDSFLFIDRYSSKYVKFGFIIVLTIIVGMNLINKKIKVNQDLLVLMCIFNSIFLLNSILTKGFYISLLPNLTVMFCSVLAFIGYYYISNNNLEKFIKIIIVSSILVSLWGILQYISNFNGVFISQEIKSRWAEFGITGGNSLDESYHRITGTFFSPNTLGVFLNTIIILNTILILNKNYSPILKPLFLKLALIINLLALFLTFSRTSWFSLGITLLVFFLIKYKEKSLVIITTLIFGIGLFLLSIPTEYWVTKLRIDSGLGLRYYLWLDGWLIFKDYPIQGIGHGMFQYFYNNYIYIQSSHAFEHPHNMLLFILSEFGAIGMILFSIFTLMMFYYLIKKYKTYNKNHLYSSYLISTICIFILHLGSGVANKGTVIGWSSPTFLFWILIGVAFKIGNEKYNEKSS